MRLSIIICSPYPVGPVKTARVCYVHNVPFSIFLCILMSLGTNAMSLFYSRVKKIIALPEVRVFYETLMHGNFVPANNFLFHKL